MSPQIAWEFVVLVCIVLALAPPLVRHYSHVGWRIPVWHGVVAMIFILLAASFAAKFIRATHSVDRTYYLYDHGMPLDTSDVSVAADIPYTPIWLVLFNLCLQSLLPGVVVLFISIFLLRYWRYEDATKLPIAAEALGIVVGGFAGLVTFALCGTELPLRLSATLPLVVCILIGIAAFGFGGWLATRFSDVGRRRLPVILHWAIAGAIAGPTIEILFVLIATSNFEREWGVGGPTHLIPAYTIAFCIGSIIGGGLGMSWSQDALDGN